MPLAEWGHSVPRLLRPRVSLPSRGLMPLSIRMNVPASFPTESQIEDLVTTFYARIRKHPTLGPIFERVIGDDWTPHLKLMCDFWSSVMLTTGRYKGRPIPAHVRINQQHPQ